MYFDDAYSTPYTSDDNYQGTGPTFTVSTAGSSLGLFLGSYFGANTYNYDFNGVTGTIGLPALDDTAFLGFGNPGGAISVTFTLPAGSEVDVPHFLSGAVPEPGTWTMMLAGVAVAGVSLRSARRRCATA